MPQKNANQQATNKSIDDSMQSALTRALSKMPTVQRPVLMPSNDNAISKLMAPRDAFARTGRFSGNILYNPDAVSSLSDNEKEDIMTHELTHTKQAQETPWYKMAYNTLMNNTNPPAGLPSNSPMNSSYQWNPLEMEAFQAERMRNILTPGYSDPQTGARDIPLPSPRRK